MGPRRFGDAWVVRPHEDMEHSDKLYRRMVPDGFMADIPVWARIITVSGPLGAIAVFLVWTGANTMPKMQQEIVILQQQHALMQQLEQQRDKRAEDLYRLMQQICANTAKDNVERKSCFDR